MGRGDGASFFDRECATTKELSSNFIAIFCMVTIVAGMISRGHRGRILPC